MLPTIRSSSPYFLSFRSNAPRRPSWSRIATICSMLTAIAWWPVSTQTWARSPRCWQTDSDCAPVLDVRVVEGRLVQLVLEDHPGVVGEGRIDLLEGVDQSPPACPEVVLAGVVRAIGQPDLDDVGPGLPGDVAAGDDLVDRLASDGCVGMAQRPELVVLVLERVRVDAADPDPSLRRERRERPEVLDLVPRDVQRDGLRDPRVAGDRGRILDLLEHVPRDAGLRKHAEPRPGVDEPPRRDLDGQIRRRPADSVGLGAAESAGIARVALIVCSSGSPSVITPGGRPRGSSCGTPCRDRSAGRSARPSPPASGHSPRSSAIWLVNRSKSSTSR